MNRTIKKITDSFPDYRYDMETTKWDWVIFFWNSNNKKFFFELPIVKELKVSPRVKIYLNDEWKTFEDDNIDFLIEKTKELLT